MTKRGDPKPPGADKPGGSGGTKSPRPAFPIHEHIGRQLRAMFDDVEAQPVPDHIRKLLEELERKGAKE